MNADGPCLPSTEGMRRGRRRQQREGGSRLASRSPLSPLSPEGRRLSSQAAREPVYWAFLALFLEIPVKLICRKSQLKGAVTIPGSKSHTIRALFLAMLADGVSEIIDPYRVLGVKQ